MAYMNKKIAVTLKLPQLQNLIKRDPDAYKDEFFMQKAHFDSELEIFKLRPTKDSERFTELVSFMSHTISCYPAQCDHIPLALMQLLELQANVLHPDVRSKLFQALVILRKRDVIEPLVLIKLAFKLFIIPDKTLRLAVGEYIMADIKALNSKRHNEKLNKSIQATLFDIVNDNATITARKTVEILSELYRKRIWTDARTVNVLGIATLSQTTRVAVSAVNFFLGIETKMLEDDEEELKEGNSASVDFHEHSKKTKKRQRSVKLQKEKNEKTKRDHERKVAESVPLFPAIQLLHDPQSLADKLFKRLRQTGERFEVKLLLMNFVSRLIGCHKLLLLSFYSFLQRYLTSHQKDVTHILAYLIQSCHDLIPPEEVVPVIKSIAQNFITERCTNEVMAVGINSVREVISRVPAVLHEPGMDDFVQDLAQYSKKTHKSVMTAAHGVVNLVRDLYPTLLRKGDRGKFHDPTHVPVAYGHVTAAKGVDGIELLDAYERGEIRIDKNDNVIWREDDPLAGQHVGSGDDEDGDNDSYEEVDSEDEDSDPENGWLDVKEEDGGNETQSGDNHDDEEEEEEEDDEDEEEEDEDEEEEEEEEEEDRHDGEEDDDDDDDEEEEVEGKQNPKAELNKNSLQADARRVLTDDDFSLLARLKAAQTERALDPRNRTKGALVLSALKRKRAEDEEDENKNSSAEFSIDPAALGAGMKTGKTSKIEKITNVLKGRKEVRYEKEAHGGGLTNKEKERMKNFLMVRKGKRSVVHKVNKSNSTARWEKMHKREEMGRDRRKKRRT